MKNKSNKMNKRGFTLAELMVIMAVMTVILAAVAPIFTGRYSNMSFDNVWSIVGASNNNDIYSDAPGRAMMQESLIGITPIDMEDLRKTLTPFSKVIIRSGDKVGTANNRQKQIEFRYNGNTQGYLFAGNYNLLLGGNYNSTKFDYKGIPDLDYPKIFTPDETNAIGNTALGSNSMNMLTTGQYNTALGYNTLSSLTTGDYNTVVGNNAASYLTSGKGNVIFGDSSAYKANSGDYNVIYSIEGGNGSNDSNLANYSVFLISSYITNLYYHFGGDYNTSIGGASIDGKYNTAIGSNSFKKNYYNSNFQYNTAIGANSCSHINSNSKYLTCVGGDIKNTPSISSTAINFYNDSKERVLIGAPVSKYNSAATLEVHNFNSDDYGYPYHDVKLGDSSVVVNGNLIVRGQTFLLGKSPFPLSANSAASYSANTPSLMGFKLYLDAASTHKPLIGFDGSEYTTRIKESQTAANGADYMHEKYTAREHCICNYSCNKNSLEGIKSYRWSYLRANNYNYVLDSSLGGNNYFWGSNPHYCGASFDDSPQVVSSSNLANIELNAASNITEGHAGSSTSTFLLGGSCCPILTPSGIRPSDQEGILSDRNLKYIGKKYTSGIETLSKLRIYNYVFKADEDKLPHTGVIAQDLKRVFPNSVSTGSNGYYKIRWDEMFYAAINSVKELYQNITKLCSNIENDISRINKLKKDNAALEQELSDLSRQLDKIENKK